MDRCIGVVAVALVFGKAVAVVVDIRRVGGAGKIGAGAVLIDPVAADFLGIGMDGCVRIVAVALVFGKPVSVVVDISGVGRARQIVAGAVLIDAVSADFLGVGMDGGVGVVAVALVFGKPVSVVVDISGVGRARQIVAGAVLIDAVSADFLGVGMDGGVGVVAVALVFGKPVSVVVDISGIGLNRRVPIVRSVVIVVAAPTTAAATEREQSKAQERSD